MKSSTRAKGGGDPGGGREVLVATGLRLRGPHGFLTARLVPAGIDQIEGRSWVLVGRAGEPGVRREVEEHSIYNNSLVIKFRGIDDAAGAEGLVGQDILMPCNGLVDLPEGSYYIFELVGLAVRTRDGRDLGTVRDVVETGGTPLLVIEGRVEGGRLSESEILLPAARSICTAIDVDSGIITVDPPEGLLELYGL